MTFSYDNFMIDTKVGFMCVKIEKRLWWWDKFVTMHKFILIINEFINYIINI
jgi:hypothetical protein